MKTLEQLEKQAIKLGKEIKELKQFNKEFQGIPEKPKLINKWYKTKDWGNTDFGALIFITEFKESSVSGYGFNAIGWNNQNDTWAKKNFTIPATDKEVEQALIPEAKKKGHNYCNWRFKDNVLSGTNGCLHGGGAVWRDNIFKDGIWAEIIKDKVPTINGYEMEDLGCQVKFGCYTFDKGCIRNLYSELSQFNSNNNDAEIKQFFINNEYTITIDELKQVVEFLNKKQ